MAYKMRRGKNPPYKMMGSSPYKEDSVPDPDPPKIESPEPAESSEPMEVNLPPINTDTSVPSDSSNRGNINVDNREEFKNLDAEKAEKYQKVQEDYERSIEEAEKGENIFTGFDDREVTEKDIEDAKDFAEETRKQELYNLRYEDKLKKEAAEYDPTEYQKSIEDIGPEGGFYVDEDGKQQFKMATGAIDYDPAAIVPGGGAVVSSGGKFVKGLKLFDKVTKPVKPTIKEKLKDTDKKHVSLYEKFKQKYG